MVGILGWLAKRLRPPGGWSIFLLTLVALLCLPASVLVVVGRLRDAWMLQLWEPAAGVLLALTIAGALSGYVLAHSRLSSVGAGAACLVSGLVLTTITVGKLVPPWALLWSRLQDAFNWAWLAQRSIPGWPPPFSSITPLLAQRLDLLATNLLWDVRSVAGGGSVWATTASVLLSGFLLWSVAFFASWRIYRRQSPMVALLPAGALLATLAYRYAPTTYYLFMFLACALCLVAACHLWANRNRWESTTTDHPGQLGLELVFAVAPWILALLILAGVFPTSGFRPVSRAFWGRAEVVLGPFDDSVESEEFGPGTLPQAHLLGSGPQRLDAIVMYVRTNDPAPPDQTEGGDRAPVLGTPRYWRGDTFDLYTGLGWLSSLLEPTNIPAKGILEDAAGSEAYLLQRFELQTDGPHVYAANAPQQVDQAVQAWWRGPGDLGRLTSNAETYSVISRPPETDISHLSASQEARPAWVTDRYLALPETVPERVHDLARRVIGDAERQYDKALAIETFLRAYTYNLDLPAPPQDRDLVDYFLFELQEGYCDYYASAMVVMARSVGVPARLVTGFGQGEYDRDLDRWVVTDEDAHSWVEVYFDGVGWVDFEPTAGRPALTRTGEDEEGHPSVPALPIRSVPWQKQLSSVVLVVLAAILASAAIGSAIWLYGRRVRGPTDLVADRYGRLLQWGVRLGAPLRSGQTPQEYATAFASQIRASSHDSRWRRIQSAGECALPSVEALAQAYVFSQYGTRPLTSSQVTAIRYLWADLRHDLLWLWLFRPRA